MKNLYLIGLILLATAFTACETAKTDQNTANNSQNQNASSETALKETSTERHIKIKSENSFDKTYSRLKKRSNQKNL